MLLLFLFFLTACAKDNPPVNTVTIPPPIEDNLDDKAKLYAELTRELEDDQGVLPQFTCDSLLFQSFYEMATFGDLDLALYQGEPGQFFRKPSHDCFYRDEAGEPVSNGSKTTISRDMFLGLFLWIYVNDDLQKSKDLIDFGKKQSPAFFMGDGVSALERESRTHLRPSLIGTLYQLTYRLEGEDNPLRYTPFIPTARVDGYQLHLVVTHTLLRGLIFDGISNSELGVLKDAVQKQPANAYYQAVYHHFKDGDQSKAIEILLDETLFPADRLPSGKDRCSDYIFQRDDDRHVPDPDKDDWKPCKDGSDEVHTGVDFLWTYRIIKGLNPKTMGSK